MALRHARIVALLLLASIGGARAAQAPDRTPEPGRRIGDRIAVLQREADALAKQARTLVGDLRTLEIARDIRAEEARNAEAAVKHAQDMLQATTARLSALELQRLSQLPDLKVQLVDIYKRGRTGYARLLFGADDVRSFARATRSIAALASISQRRISEHQRTLAALEREHAQRETIAASVQQRERDAQQARDAAARAVAARGALIARIDSQRDLNAQYVGELQVAYDRIQQQVSAPGARANDAIAVPLAPFRGALEWPVPGRLTSRFGQTGGRLGGTAVRNGIEISAAEGAPVRAVHGGTVGFADQFTGFGTLVILDHGGNAYSLYGYLASTNVSRGDTVHAGADLGRVGSAPAGPPALYFEVRIDGRSVDPIQWLKAR